MEPAGDPAEDQSAKAELAADMSEHFSRATTLQQALIDGDLERVHASAKWMTEHDDPKAMPASASADLEAMRAAAKQALDAPDLAAAAKASASMAHTCGSCHARLGTGPKFGAAGSPTPAPDTVSHMLRHQWAAQRMHEGLVGPSDESWKAGAAALAEVPLEACDVDAGGVLTDDLVELRHDVHALGSKAASATDSTARVEVYGALLATCASCHTGGC